MPLENNQLNDKNLHKGSPGDHLANERTFLAWVRTSIGLMASGFAVAKFTLFVKQITYSVRKEAMPSPGYSSILGILLVGIGALLGLLAFLRYRRLEKQLENATYSSSRSLTVFLTLFILLIGVLLILYLMSSPI